MKSRILIVFTGLMILWGALVFRAAQLQLLPDHRLQSLQERQFQTVVTLQPRRGAILDRKGRELAVSTTAYSLYADPKLLHGQHGISKKLAHALGQPYETLHLKLKDPNKRFIWLARLLPKEKYEQIKSWDIRGLSFVEEFRRVYPNETLFSSGLGFVGNEGQGLEGLELTYENVLRGDKKKVSVRRDARGRPLIADGMMFAEALEGAQLHLTLDSDVQHMVEQQITKAVAEFDADQAFAVVLDAHTSAIVAMANTPLFDANKAIHLVPELRRNRAVADGFEPGSVMKSFAIAAAMREKKIAPNTRIDTENGSFRIGDRVIHEAETNEKWDHLSVAEVLAKSSNIGTTKIAFMLGDADLRKALEDFGFGSKTGVDLPGESKGTLLPLPWRPHLLSNISFGQGVVATPLQIANAYAVIANGGVFHQPYLVENIHNFETGQNISGASKDEKRVLSPEDAASLRMMLAGVTAPGGTGANAKVDGFVVGGKTGTAQKVRADGKGYMKDGFISSFAGFIPANDPQYVIFIAVDHPKRQSHFGSQVAAPVFSEIASYLVRQGGVAPLSLSEENLVPRVKRELAGDRPFEAAQPFRKTALTANEIINAPRIEKMQVMPELKGLTSRQVLQKFSGQPLQLHLVGQGLVSEVIPASGSDLGEAKKITVILK